MKKKKDAGINSNHSFGFDFVGITEISFSQDRKHGQYDILIRLNLWLAVI